MKIYLEYPLSDRLISKIEEVLGFTLYSWQRDYLQGRIENCCGDRQQGNTTAYILRLLLCCREPLYVRTFGEWSELADYSSFNYTLWFKREVLTLKDFLSKNGIFTRDLYV